MFRFIQTCLVAVFAARASATANPEALIKQVQDRYNGARTLSVHFEESYSQLGHKRPAETGTLTLRKGGKMRWDYTRPAGKLFISDGKSLFLYTAADNRVEKIPLRDTEDMRAPLAFLLGKFDLKKEFRDFEVHERVDGVALNASAKNGRLPYKTIQMLIAGDGAILQLQVAGDADSFSYVFRDEKLNVPVNDDSFRFTPPAGAEIVDAVELRSEGKE